MLQDFVGIDGEDVFIGVIGIQVNQQGSEIFDDMGIVFSVEDMGVVVVFVYQLDLVDIVFYFGDVVFFGWIEGCECFVYIDEIFVVLFLIVEQIEFFDQIFDFVLNVRSVYICDLE